MTVSFRSDHKSRGRFDSLHQIGSRLWAHLALHLLWPVWSARGKRSHLAEEESCINRFWFSQAHRASLRVLFFRMVAQLRLNHLIRSYLTLAGFTHLGRNPEIFLRVQRFFLATSGLLLCRFCLAGQETNCVWLSISVSLDVTASRRENWPKMTTTSSVF